MSPVSIEVVEDPAEACAAMLIDVAAGGAAQIVLAGGSTPRAANYEFVRRVTAGDVDLSGLVLWFGDERCVAPEDARSNYLMVRESLLEPLGSRAPSAVHRIEGELGFDKAASAYEEELRSSGPPSFDLLMLGIGSDGHTASMFPDQASLSERSRLVVGVPVAALEPLVPRVTLTLAGLALARRIVVLAVGSSKATPVAKAFGSDARPDPHVPSSMLAGLDVWVTVLLDEAAAGKL